MIDLNGQEFKQVSIFNDGKAGLVENIRVTVDKKESSDTSNKPDFNLVLTDPAGATLRNGWYYFKPMPNEDENTIGKKWNREIGRLLHIARAVMGNDFQFPSVNTREEAYDTIFNIIATNAPNQTFNVFVTYGTTNYVNKGGYLRLRYFDFIENGKTEVSRLRAKPSDLLERIVPDAETKTPTASVGGGGINLNTANVQSWT